MNEEKELPEGWVWTTLGNIRIDQSKTLEPNKFSEQRFELYSVPSFELKIPEIVLGSAIGSNKQTVETGTVLLCKINPRINRAWVVGHFSDCPKIASTEWISFFKLQCLNPQYLCYYLSLKTVRDYLASNASGVGGSLMRINSHTIVNYLFPLAPLAEQQRIVSAIEERFTILDAVATALQQNKQKLKRARASVLKYAVEGKLTEQWRAEHPVTESGSQLLERILAERRAKWEAEQLAKGKDPRKLRYDEPKGPDVSELPEVPEGWCWATVEQIANVIGGVTKGRDLVGRKTLTLPYLRVANVQRGYIDTSIMKSIEVLIDECERYLLHKGDIVLTEGGDADKLGRAAVWGKQIEDCIHQNHIFRARLINRNMPSKWLECYTNSEQGRAYFLRSAKQTVNLASINMTQLKRCPLPLPPLAEQQQIVAEVERRLSVIEQAQVAIETSLKRIERARQSILEQAFSGLLVPQDPHDEPASVLLERIQQERASRAGEGKQRARNGAVKVVRNRKTPEQAFVPQWQLLQEAQQSASIQDGASESSEVRQGEMDREELGELVQMPLFSQWD